MDGVWGETYLEIRLDGFPAARHVGDELRSLGECEAEHVVVRYLAHKMQDIVEVRQNEFLKRLPLVCLRRCLADGVKYR